MPDNELTDMQKAICNLLEFTMILFLAMALPIFLFGAITPILASTFSGIIDFICLCALSSDMVARATYGNGFVW